jgi:DNA (cytosine-5)-methyltransferase 1
VPAYYSENDPKAAAWLRELIHANLIAPGDVDERSIVDVTPSDLAGYNQCHFFAGIGGWSYALRLAGWPDDRAVWTGSCPCQPFSTAGKGAGFADERHLWPAWFHLIRQCRPPVVFGEQVANALGWLDLVSTDLEAENYAFGAVIVGAHSVRAPHIRQRLYWVADAGSQRQQQHAERNRESLAGAEASCGDDTDGRGDVGNTAGDGRQGRALRGQPRIESTTNAWTCDFIPCTDGKARPVEPGSFPLAHGVPHRVGLLRGYGNAIVPQVAATFIEAYLDGCRE